MRFVQTIVVGAIALVSSVVAQTTVSATSLSITSAPASVVAGQTYTIQYVAPAGDAVSLILRKGDAKNLQTVTTLTSSATGGSYQWAVSKDLENDDTYAIMITQGSNVNYYGPFALTGGADATSSSASASASTSASTSATITPSASLSSAVSSLSSLISAANSTLAALASSNATMTSDKAIMTPSSNTTMLRTSTTTLSSTSTSASRTASSTGGAPTSGAASPIMVSPIALIFGAVAAMVFFN